MFTVGMMESLKYATFVNQFEGIKSMDAPDPSRSGHAENQAVPAKVTHLVSVKTTYTVTLNPGGTNSSKAFRTLCHTFLSACGVKYFDNAGKHSTYELVNRQIFINFTKFVELNGGVMKPENTSDTNAVFHSVSDNMPRHQ